MTPENQALFQGPTASRHRDGQLIVSRLGSDTVGTMNHSRITETTNQAATPAPRITEMITVHDVKAQSLHLLLVHRLDYRPQKTTVSNVVVFSEPQYAAFRTKKLQLGTPAFYRKEESLKAGIHDPHDGTLTKDATRWASDAVFPGRVKHAEVSFAALREPWVYCASHYRTDRELRRLREDFAKRGRSTATGIAGPNTFATWLGINLALTLKKSEVRLHAREQAAYARSRYDTNLWQGSAPIDTVVYVYHGPVHYEDSSGRVDTQEDWSDPNAGPKAWFTKKMCFETQSEYRFAVCTIGDPVEPKHYIEVSPELSKLSSAL